MLCLDPCITYVVNYLTYDFRILRAFFPGMHVNTTLNLDGIPKKKQTKMTTLHPLIGADYNCEITQSLKSRVFLKHINESHLEVLC